MFEIGRFHLESLPKTILYITETRPDFTVLPARFVPLIFICITLVSQMSTMKAEWVQHHPISEAYRQMERVEDLLRPVCPSVKRLIQIIHTLPPVDAWEDNHTKSDTVLRYSESDQPQTQHFAIQQDPEHQYPNGLQSQPGLSQRYAQLPIQLPATNYITGHTDNRQAEEFGLADFLRAFNMDAYFGFPADLNQGFNNVGFDQTDQGHDFT
jgi:hypothetical protein